MNGDLALDFVVARPATSINEPQSPLGHHLSQFFRRSDALDAVEEAI
ncbi:TPA: hypothetical protein VDV10_004071 [Pseudomonas aeruginosa]|nr:hypothetical protein [Pseudomonas aeruginosa]